MSEITHEDMLAVYRRDPLDYTPYGEDERWADPERAYSDCSCGCVFFAEIEGKLGYDWGVCTNPKSHRAGLLTFEHQGCRHFQGGPVEEDDE